MKIRMYVGLAFVLLVAINSPFSTASAQGTAFTYQGLLDDGGAPANGTYDFRFRPFNALTNGSFFGQINLDRCP